MNFPAAVALVVTLEGAIQGALASPIASVPVLLAVAWILALSVAAFALCLLDKRRAIARAGSDRGPARVRERTLLGLALLGGSPGLILGMLLARHKTRKAAFLAPLALVTLAQLAVLAWSAGWLR